MTTELNDYFSYRYIDSEFTKEQIKKNFDSLNQQFSELTKNWNITLNSQWVLRDYLAVKMILSSTVMISSVEFANEKNIRIIEPYLIYYSLLNCSRAVLLTSPKVEWNNGELFQMTHKKMINIIGDIISSYSKEKGKELKKFIDWAREYREIFSYKFPANGLKKHHLSLEKCKNVCRLLCEIAQFQSKILENSITKHVHSEFSLDREILSEGYIYGKENFQFIDEEDGYRLDYIERKQKRPYSIHSTMTEGMVEDFFGAWYPKDDSNIDEVYNPDENWQILFPMP